MTETREQIEYIRAHINNRPRTNVARAAGVSITTAYRIIRKLGGEMDYTRTRRDPKNVDLIREYYPTMSCAEIQRRFGISSKLVSKIARELGLSHTSETVERMKRQGLEKLAMARKSIDQAARVAKWKARRRLDEMRVWEGKPQKTRFRLQRMPNRDYKAWWRLINNYGYVSYGDVGDYTLWYDADTHRVKEDYYENKYKFTFKEIKDDERAIS